MPEATHILGYDIKLIELAVIAIGTLASTVIASVAIILTVRHNRGLRPRLVVTNYGLDAKTAPPGYYLLEIRYQVWNLRTYPIVAINTQIVFESGFLSKRPQGHKASPWSVSDKRVVSDINCVVGPGQHHELNVSVPFPKEQPSKIAESFRIQLRYRDPMKRDSQTITMRGVAKFSMRASLQDRIFQKVAHLWPFSRWSHFRGDAWEHFDVEPGHAQPTGSGESLESLLDTAFLENDRKQI